MPTFLRWCHGCEGRSEPLDEYPDDRTCTHCGSEDTMVERVDREDSLPGPRRRLADEADELLTMDEAHDTQERSGSAWLQNIMARREEEAARRGIGAIPDSQRGDR